MDDLISRQAAIDLMKIALEDDWEPDYATDRINDLPSAQPDADVKCGIAIQNIKDIPSADVVEVVRCKDCKHMHESLLNGSPFETFCDVFPAYIHKDDYCSYGERAGISLIDTRKEGAK